MANQVLTYDPSLKNLAKGLRKKGVLSEVLLWQNLKKKLGLGYDFHRQKPISKYIVDFFCPELMLAIEIDGVTHNDKLDRDRIRQNHLEQLGISFLRFTDNEVKSNLPGVLEAIQVWILKNGNNTPRPTGTPL